MRSLLLIIIALFALTNQAEAKRSHHQQTARTIECGRFGCNDVQRRPASYRKAGNAPTLSRHVARRAVADAEVVAHPAGCPRIAFCACGAAVRLFGKPIRSLWRAAAWFKFPRAMPAANMVAVRMHHVMVLLAHVSGSIWQVYDANSGGHLTRIHERSIAGYVVVNPHSSRTASL